MAGPSGAVVVPVAAGQAAGDAKIWIRHYSPIARRLTVRVNGKDAQTVEVATGWATSEITVPADRLTAPGENEIVLFTSKGEPLEIEWMQVGGTAAADDAPRVYDLQARALALAATDGLVYYVMVPDEGRVVGDVVGAGCSVRVAARPQVGAAVEGTLAGKGAAVELGALAGKVVRLELAAAGCPAAGLAAAGLVVPGPAPQVQRGPAPRHVILWIMDSLRADRVRTFIDGARPEVPTFDRLAATSAVFAQTYVQGNESRASHASIWSSLYPIRHQMITAKAKLDDKWVTVDEVMKQAGMFTSGLSGNGYVISRWGFGTKWDKYRNTIHEGGGVTAAEIVGLGLASVEPKVKEPWFLYLGTIDTHVSWRAKAPWIGKYDPKPYSGKFKEVASGTDMGKVAAGSLKITDRDKERIRAIYDSNVSYQDQQLGELFEQLTAWGVADQTMVIVTADHGDEQWEVGRVGHGGSLRESLVHVPLLIHYPAAFPAGKIPEGAEVIDIVPTLADVMGVEPSPEWQGESLLPLAHGVGRGYPRLSMASQYEGAHAGRLGPWKLRAAGGSKPQLYNLKDDPTEQTDVVDQEPFAARFVGDALWMLRAYNERWRKRAWGNPANASPLLAADLSK
jgi:arylsulfatase A-like enzyme